MKVKRYDTTRYADVREYPKGLFVKHSDYAALLARHNALVEAVRGLLGSLDNGEFKTTITHSIAAEVAEKVYRINRAEVDRLIAGEAQVSVPDNTRPGDNGYGVVTEHDLD